MIAVFLFSLLAGGAAAAAEPGRIHGVVRTIAGQALPDAEIQVQGESNGVRWKAFSGQDGSYTIDQLPPGLYKVRARLAGFRTVAKTGVGMDSQQALHLDFALEMLALHETVTVVSDSEELDPSKGDGLLLSREGQGASLPTNGRDFRVSFDLMPGVITTPAATSDAGQFTSQGQRPNSNTFRLDGVSVNTGIGGSTLPGSLPGASLPAMNAAGSTENLASPETAQSVEFRTSNFGPEFGDRPGSQVFVMSRAGSAEFHGAVFGNIRDNSWTARDWFANSRNIPYLRSNYRHIGGSIGGPIWRNRTFFFAGVERSAIRDTGVQLASVPSLATLQSLPPEIRDSGLLFPYNSGRDLGNGLEEGVIPTQRFAVLSSFSTRIDHSIGSNATLFFRFVNAPSESTSIRLFDNRGAFGWKSGVVGLTVGQSTNAIHDLRLGYSRADYRSMISGLRSNVIFQLAGMARDGVPFLGKGIAPLPFLLPSNTTLGLSIAGLGQFVSGDFGGVRQDQWNTKYCFSKIHGRHQWKAGIEYLGLAPSREAAVTSLLGNAGSLQGLLNGEPISLVTAWGPTGGANVHLGSVFAQDEVRIGRSLSIVYGLRWEVTVPLQSSVRYFTGPSMFWNGAEWLRPAFYPQSLPWPMRFGQIAPRIGLAYRLPFRGLVLRASAGKFYDTTLGSAINPVNGAPFNSWQVPPAAPVTGASIPRSVIDPADNNADIQRFLVGPYSELCLPTSYQWRLSLEKNVFSRGIVSAAYAGSLGRNLLGNQAYVNSAGIQERFATLTENSSDYHALLVRYSGMAARNLYVSASYTWSHSIDDGSQDSAVFLWRPGTPLRDARASSNFDVRHALTGAVSYRISWKTGFRGPDALAGWTVSGVFRARTGFPLNILNHEPVMGRVYVNAGRPDLVVGRPVWIEDQSVAGHRRLNPLAFVTPSGDREGSLGRNAVSGRGMVQLDASLRREFGLYRRLSLQTAVNIFNVLNHPSFADPVPYLSSPWFGQSTSMQNLMLGSGSPNSGLPTMFQTGGARSVEFSVRVSF